MRRYQLVLGCVTVATLLVMGLMGGCGEKPQETDMIEPPMSVDQPPDGGPPAGADTPAADIPAGAETLSDVLGSFQMPTSFVMTVTESSGEAAEEPGARIAMKMDGEQAAKMRMEEEGGAEVLILDMEASTMYSYNTSTNEGFKMPLAEEEAQDAPAPWGDYDPEAKVVGSEEMDGVDCWVVEVTGDDGPGKMWIGKRDGLMRKAEGPDGSAVFSYTDIDAVADSEFEVPEGIELADMSDFGEMMEDAE